MTDKQGPGLAALGVALCLLGGIFAIEAWPESTQTSGECVRDVRCPPYMIERGSAAWTVVGCALALVGVVLVLTALKRAKRQHVTTG